MSEKLLIGLVGSADGVCCRYRLAAFIPYLEAHGWKVELRPIPSRFVERLKAFRTTRAADAVILQRKLLDQFQFGVLRRNARKLIFDFDDAIYQRDSFARSRLRSKRSARRFRFAVERADVVIAGNSFLAEQASRFAAPHRVHVLPTCVEPGHYAIPGARPERGTSEDLTMVWIGSASTLGYLEQSRDVWETIGEAFPDVRLKVICDRFPRFENLRSCCVSWSKDSEAVELGDSEVGVSIVLDDAWSRGKCGLKILQYMAASLPVLTNPVGVHTEMVEHGRSGILVRNPSEWVKALRVLSSDRDLARAMGRRGREIVEERYSVEHWAPRLLQLLN